MKSVGASSSSGSGEGIGYAPLSSSDQWASSPGRRVASISILSCSKLCAVSFLAGLLVGYSLKRRVNRWVSKLLRRFKDD